MISGNKTRSVFDRYDIVSDHDLGMTVTQHNKLKIDKIGS
jgi:hypothetical protein